MAEVASNESRSFGQYDVESVLGRGAMGMVYLARDRRIGRKVALKTVQVDQKFEDESEANEFYKRLQREAEVVGALQHPNIVTLYEPGYENNVISYLATEYVDGESLKDRLKRSKPLPLDEALRLGDDILRGLAYAHSKGIIHRDIKPANILVTSDGQAKLADFGIARPVDSNLTAVGSMLGTPNYMSPEQVKCAPVTTKSDLFSVGVVFYEMLTGLKPFASPDVSGILRNVVEKDPQPASEANQSVPPAVADFVKRLFAKAPAARFESATAALNDLQKLRANVPAVTPQRIEQLGPEPAIETIATGPTGTTVRTGAISAAMFWGVLAALVIPIAAWAVAIQMETDPQPMGVITVVQRTDFATKKHSLANARSLAEAGRYDEALSAYDVLLQKYPGNLAATAGRAEAAKRLEAAKAKTTVTSHASKSRPLPAKPAQAPPEEPKKRSMWNRIFHRGDAPPATKPPAKKPPSKQ